MSIFGHAKERKIEREIQRQQKIENEKIEKENRRKEFEKKALTVLELIFEIDPFKYRDVREGILGFRQIILDYGFRNSDGDAVYKKAEIIQLFSTAFKSHVVLLHDNLSKAEISSITEHLAFDLVDTLKGEIELIKMPDKIDELSRALSLFLPKFECIHVKSDPWYNAWSDAAPNTNELPYPRTADLSYFATKDQLKEFTHYPFDTLLCAHDNWVENHGAIGYLGISRELYDQVVSAYSNLREMLEAEIDSRSEELSDSEENSIPPNVGIEDDENQRKIKREMLEAEIDSRSKESSDSKENSIPPNVGVEDDENQRIIKSGQLGEKEVAYCLSWLENDYIILAPNQKDLPDNTHLRLLNPAFKSEPQEYDHIVIGKQGVFLIETKNYAGEIQINEAGNWLRKKKEDSDFSALENPTAQVRRHEKLMQTILADYPSVNIISIICLANKNVVIRGEKNCKIPVIRADMITEFIESYDGNETLSKGEIEKIAKLVESYEV